MSYELPKIKDSGVIPFDHFPTRMQCFIFRNWGMIEPHVLAKVLGCREEQVRELAVMMGLEEYPSVSEEWLTKGYITIIRANWHLCSYEQLAYMLGWSLDKLAFIIREDDFLGTKMGGTKPVLPELKYAELTDDQKKRTDFVKRSVEDTLKNKVPESVKPFDFIPMFEEVVKSAGADTTVNHRFENRIIYSYCSLYGDVFADQTLLEASFPDKLLEAYRALGINAIWTQALFSMLSPFPFDESLSEGYQIRIANMNRLVEKLKKYGIKLFLYINEPRAMPFSFFEKYPDIKGDENINSGYACLCVSNKKVREYLFNASAYIAKNVPELGGYITITASENHTNCYSKAFSRKTTCPICAKRTPCDVIEEVNRCIYEGAASVKSDFTMIAWNWAWKKFGNKTVEDIISKLPEKVNIMSVSEEDVKKSFDGVETRVIDYSISVEGPGEYAKSVWKKAHDTGHKAYAKLQLGNTWEMAATPCIPAFEKIYRSLSRLVSECDVSGVMLGWTLGGFPSYNLRIAQGFYEKEEKVPSLGEFYKKLFPDRDPKKMENAFHILSEAFDDFPFEVEVAYNAPQHYGSSNLLFPESTGYRSTMVGFPYDSLDTWRSVFPRDIFIAQLKKMSDGWHEGFLALEKAADGTKDESLKALVGQTRVIDCHFRSMYNQSMFVVQREKGIIDTDIACEEKELAKAVLDCMAKDSTIGYEASNHYFFTKNTLLEKVVNCDYIINSYGK